MGYVGTICTVLFKLDNTGMRQQIDVLKRESNLLACPWYFKLNFICLHTCSVNTHHARMLQMQPICCLTTVQLQNPIRKYFDCKYYFKLFTFILVLYSTLCLLDRHSIFVHLIYLLLYYMHVCWYVWLLNVNQTMNSSSTPCGIAQ